MQQLTCKDGPSDILRITHLSGLANNLAFDTVYTALGQYVPWEQVPGVQDGNPRRRKILEFQKVPFSLQRRACMGAVSSAMSTSRGV